MQAAAPRSHPTDPSRRAARRWAAAMALGLAAIAPVALAEETTAAAAETVLEGSQLTEANLLDALAPVRTRTIKIGATRTPPRASLLITFETNSAELTPAARRQLDVVAAALGNERLAGSTFGIEGHADPRGQAKANLVLSRLRAESVRQYLAVIRGIDQDRLTAEGKGDLFPLKPEVPAAPENRRVTLVSHAPGMAVASRGEAPGR
jgi:OOP family OmpA-OmpF porin